MQTSFIHAKFMINVGKVFEIPSLLQPFLRCFLAVVLDQVCRELEARKVKTIIKTTTKKQQKDINLDLTIKIKIKNILCSINILHDKYCRYSENHRLDEEECGHANERPFDPPMVHLVRPP